MTPTPERWLERYLEPLIGAVIVDVLVKRDDLGEWPVIKVRTPHVRDSEGKPALLRLEIGHDPEGNGPGWIFGLPQPK